MIADFPCHRQQSAGSCLPTSVFSVLSYYGCSGITIDDIAIWCRAGQGGYCDWNAAVMGLGEHVDVDELIEDWDRVVHEVSVNLQPVIVTIALPGLALLEDHAVVVVGVAANQDQVLRVNYMDPGIGAIREDPIDEFLMKWDLGGSRGLLLQGT